jgi:hypothetical protein
MNTNNRILNREIRQIRESRKGLLSCSRISCGSRLKKTRRDTTLIHKFTWQPHGSQFTIIEEVPANRLAIKIRKPPELDKEAVLKALEFDSSWVEIIK